MVSNVLGKFYSRLRIFVRTLLSKGIYAKIKVNKIFMISYRRNIVIIYSTVVTR